MTAAQAHREKDCLSLYFAGIGLEDEGVAAFGDTGNVAAANFGAELLDLSDQFLSEFGSGNRVEARVVFDNRGVSDLAAPERADDDVR